MRCIYPFLAVGLAACTGAGQPRPPTSSDVASAERGTGDEARRASDQGRTDAQHRRLGELQAPLLDGLDAQHHEIATDDALVQRLFDQGLMLHYGFNHAEAVRSFREAARLDATCAMCFAGVALSLGPNINAPMDPAKVDEAYEAIERAQQLAEHASPHHRHFIEALSRRYAKNPPDDRTPLDEAYAEAMSDVVEAKPEDADTRSLLAEALMILHAWDYWKANGEPKPWTPRILSVLEAGLERHPDHPFLNHLYIHAVEASEEPERGLASARRLQGLAPGAGHLVHMPSHVFIRTGEYHKASLANERAIEADQEYLAQVEAQGLYPLAYYPHNYHFLWATTTLEGRAERALEAARGVAARADREQMKKPGFGTLQHYISIPYYALVAFGRWDSILEEPKPPVDLLYPQSVWQYSRGMAHAAKGNVGAARTALGKVKAAANDPTLEKVTIWDINSTGDLMHIAAALLEGEIARARGNSQRAVAHFKRAVELEDKLNYDEPPPWGPATRRFLGAALLEAGKPARAEEAYRADLANFPDNGWSLYGLLQSLRAQGESEAALEVEAEFQATWKHADTVLSSSRM